MKTQKMLLFLTVLVVVISVFTVFTLFGCKAEETAEQEVAEETAEQEVAEEVAEQEVVEETVPEEYQCNIDWRQFEGQEINLLLSAHPWQEAIMPLIPEFEELTGMKVNCTKLPHAEIGRAHV